MLYRALGLGATATTVRVHVRKDRTKETNHMETAVKHNRTLASWQASEELQTEAARLRLVPQPNPYENRDERRFDQLVRRDNIEGPRSTIASYLDDTQAAAMLNGTEFSIGRLVVRSCVFGTGRIIHLQLQRANAAQCGLLTPRELSAYPDCDGFSERTVCVQRGTHLNEFDDEMYDLLATTEKLGWGQTYPIGRVRSSEELLGMVCYDCLIRAHIDGVTPACAHGTIGRNCKCCDHSAHQRAATSR